MIKYIEQHIPKPKQPKVLKLLYAWMGIKDPVTPDFEQNPKYRTAIQGATNLMRNTGFDWIENGESVHNIGQRWAKIFRTDKHSVAFGMRFSTTVPLVITFGFLKQRRNGKIFICWIRYYLHENGLFQPQDSNLKMDFIGALLYGLQNLNTQDCGIQMLRRLDLNRYKHLQHLLNGYARAHIPKTERWEDFDDEDQNKRIGYCSE